MPLQMVGSHHVVGWDLNSGPLEEQSVLLNTEPSLQPSFGCLIALASTSSTVLTRFGESGFIYGFYYCEEKP